jgi:hypothetical protein
LINLLSIVIRLNLVVFSNLPITFILLCSVLAEQKRLSIHIWCSTILN